MNTRWLSLFAAVLLLALPTVVPHVARAQESDAETKVDPMDWPTWRGPEQSGVSREKNLITSVDEIDPRTGEGVLWKNEELATRSTPIVMDGKLYTLTRVDEGTPTEAEQVVCADAATGEILWRNRFNVYLSDVPDTRVAWSCVTGDPETGKVYALGVCGIFQCFDGETGETLWSRSLQEEYGLINTYGGRTNVPVIFEDLVIISAVVVNWGEMAKPAHRFMAFDKKSGEMVWFEGTRLIPYDTTYSTPILTTLDGQAAIVFGSGDGQVWAMEPRTGQPIWNYAFSRRGLNVTPLIVDDTVYISHSEENIEGNTMGAFVALDGSLSGDLKGKQDWVRLQLMSGKSSPLYIDGKIVTIDDRAKVWVLDAKTGDVLQQHRQRGTIQRSSPVYADGHVYTVTNNGAFYIFPVSEEGLVSQRNYVQLDGSADGSPVISHGRIYVPTSEYLYCFGTEDQEPQADPIPPRLDETPGDETPAHVQVVPCELLLYPGGKQKLTVRTFNEKGQFIHESEAEFTLEGPGEVSAQGEYTAASEPAHSAAYVTAKVGDLSGKARIRVVPELDWKWDFEDLEDAPITWIGGRVRYELRTDDQGNNYLAKRDLIPTAPGKFTKLGTRSRAMFGHKELSTYTIQADVQGQIKEGKMPDIGLVNQRYTMLLLGAKQELQIHSWDAQLRMATTIDFPWKPEVWYTMKFTSALEDGKAVLRGKVWPRGEEEPAEWTITATDESANEIGTPGLFGSTKDAEFYIDNISVTDN